MNLIHNIVECPKGLKLDQNKPFMIYAFDYIGKLPSVIYGLVDYSSIANLNGTHTTMFKEKYSLDMIDKDYQYDVRTKYTIPYNINIVCTIKNYKITIKVKRELDFEKTIFSIN